MAATPPTGKTHNRFFRLLVDGMNLSGDVRSIGAMGLSVEDLDASAWGSDIEQAMLGYADVMLNDVNVLWSNAAAGVGPVDPGSFTALKGADADRVVTVFMGIRAAPGIGVPTFMAGLKQLEFVQGAAVGQVLAASVQMRGSSLYTDNIHCWGDTLAAGAEINATGQNESVDLGAAASGGWAAHLHLAQTAGAMGSGNFTFRVEHSDDDSEWETLTTFTINGSASAAERRTGASAVNRYVRLAWTRTAGTARPWASLAVW